MFNINNIEFPEDDEYDTSFVEEPNSSINYEDDESFLEEERDDYVEEIKTDLVAKDMKKLAVANEFLEDPLYDEEADETYSFYESDDSDGEEADFEEVFDKQANEAFYGKITKIYLMEATN